MLWLECAFLLHRPLPTNHNKEAEVNGRGGTTREVRVHAPSTAFSGTAVENIQQKNKNYISVATPLFSTAVPLNAVGGACALTSRVVPPRPFTCASLVWLVGNGSNIRRNEGVFSRKDA